MCNLHSLMSSWFRYARCHHRNPQSILKSALCMSGSIKVALVLNLVFRGQVDGSIEQD
jgi:hypothetical protein